MSFHAVTFICYLCKRPRSSILGARFLQFGRYKRRVCPECLAARQPKEKSHDNPVHA